MRISDIFAEPLIDLGNSDPRFHGILTPESSLGAARVGVTAQFLENADAYHKAYFDVGYWRFLLDNALAAAHGLGEPRTIIDIGSGSGNSVIPLAERFPDATIVATDISPQLLAILREFIVKNTQRPDRFGLVCADASAANYREGAADLAVGAAILHHILEPERVIATCHRALRPGGWAIFFEPFEAGNAILNLTYRWVLRRGSPAERETPGMRFLERMVTDFTVRQRPRNDPIFRDLDDKWMFTRSYFERVRDEQGWAEVIVYALNVCATPLRNQAVVHLRLGAGLTPEALPDWAWEVIDEADAETSLDLKREWPQEGAVLFRKPAVS
jgi:ubiquinone/menaquinone biosynthesis C-methylase UbiE